MKTTIIAAALALASATAQAGTMSPDWEPSVDWVTAWNEHIDDGLTSLTMAGADIQMWEKDNHFTLTIEGYDGQTQDNVMFKYVGGLMPQTYFWIHFGGYAGHGKTMITEMRGDHSQYSPMSWAHEGKMYSEDDVVVSTMPAPVPLPAGALLVLTAMAGLAVARKVGG